MTWKARLTAVLAFGAALAAAGAAPAQTQTAGTPPPAQPTLSSVLSEPPPIKPADPNTSQPTYSVNPPPESPSGVYLPAAVLGYAKSAAGCVVVGCDDGPQTGGAPAPATPSAPPEPPPAGLGPAPADTH
jgi:hypothetical protein